MPASKRSISEADGFELDFNKYSLADLTQATATQVPVAIEIERQAKQAGAVERVTLTALVGRRSMQLRAYGKCRRR